MICVRVADRLDEFVAGRLEGAARTEVEEHLARCASCRDAAAEARALYDRTAALPRAIEPPRDLWPAIAARIAAEDRPVAAPVSSSRPVLRAGAAAAAAAVVFAAGVGVTAYVLSRTRPDPEARPTMQLATLAAYREAGAGYDAAAEELRRVLESHRGRLAPETVERLEENLRLVERALAEAWDALERDPASRTARDSFTRLHRRRLDVLRSAAGATRL